MHELLLLRSNGMKVLVHEATGIERMSGRAETPHKIRGVKPIQRQITLKRLLADRLYHLIN
jgi:hypothetical protein